VLKVCPPDDDFTCEVEALRLFQGDVMVRLLDSDAALGAMLLERIEPGTPIGDLADDEEATGVALDVMQRLWRTPPPAGPFPTVAHWFRGFGDLPRLFPAESGPPVDLLRRGERLVARLLFASDRPRLLHGDLNYGNVLSSTRGWIAIDPKGVIGDPGFDTAILLHDPSARILSAPDPRAFLVRRVDQIATATGMCREHVRDWGIAYALLSAAWSAEDADTGWEDAMQCAAILFDV
jgi:streptomycin 6-kinase